jgi:hypothetical protein
VELTTTQVVEEAVSTIDLLDFLLEDSAAVVRAEMTLNAQARLELLTPAEELAAEAVETTLVHKRADQELLLLGTLSNANHRK